MPLDRFVTSFPIKQNIFEGRDQETGEVVAMKFVEISDYEPDNDSVRMEAQTMRELAPINPSRIVECKAFYKNDQNQYVIVMERAICSLQDVIDMHKTLTEQQAKVAVFGILEALLTCHQKYILHRDVKPANVFLFSDDLNSVKLGDFGVCAEDNGYNSVGGKKGTAEFMAPEISKGQRYGRAVDLYSVGVTVVKLIGSANLSPSAKSFVDLLVSPKPEARPTVMQALLHQWLHGIAPYTSAQVSLTPPPPKVTPEPLPAFPGWVKLIPDNGDPVYYFHEESGLVQYQHPGGRQFDIEEIERTATLANQQQQSHGNWSKLSSALNSEKRSSILSLNGEGGAPKFANMVRNLTSRFQK
ncbi:kinase-like domain-containing protein [Obelidium mucronatum]|nr:kinase-like domain-containing protein [Obelidium mucronatum]